MRAPGVGYWAHKINVINAHKQHYKAVIWSPLLALSKSQLGVLCGKLYYSFGIGDKHTNSDKVH